MALIKSISGIRGTIGGHPGEGLTPVDIVKYTAAFATILQEEQHEQHIRIVIGRDGRMSGPMVQQLVTGTLVSMGVEVIDLGLSTTPTVEFAVTGENAAGGIILTASHNPKEWNALKLLNRHGEFISAATGQKVLELGESQSFQFAKVTQLGKVIPNDSYMKKHIDAILAYPLVNKDAIEKRSFRVVVDGINSSGAIFVPELLKALGVDKITVLNEDVSGDFAHNPEPLPEHLSDISSTVKRIKADLGIVVDPDVDRLCFVCEDGSMFGEEYTLVAVADYVLSKRQGNTVSNMSSTKALKELTIKAGGEYFPSAVGEVNVVAKMKEVNAVIGGEGNGGIIVPDFHYGRDALIGIGLFLSHLAIFGKSIGALRKKYPDYFISKNKIELNNGIDIDKIFRGIKEKYRKHDINTEDGLKIAFENDWVHLRTSNTEPIIRIYSESDFENKANSIANKIITDIRELMH